MQEQVFGGQAKPARSVVQAIARGLVCRCPNCGKGPLFTGFLKVVDRCRECGEELHHHRADDLPAYLVIFIVGHLVVGAFMSIEASSSLALWQHLAIWVPLTIVSAVAMLRPVKGAVVGLQWALYMHGFGGHKEPLETHPEA